MGFPSQVKINFLQILISRSCVNSVFQSIFFAQKSIFLQRKLEIGRAMYAIKIKDSTSFACVLMLHIITVG